MSVANELHRRFPGAVTEGVALSQISRWRIGGSADVLVSPRNAEELSGVRSWIYERDLPSVVIGATSNLLFADEGLRAIGIHIGPRFSSVSIDGGILTAGPGAWVPGVVRKSMLAGLTGIEHACGIPGTLGGLVCMNGGSQRRGIGEHVRSVGSVDERGNLVRRRASECGFSYRKSVFQENNEVLSEIVLALDPAEDKNVCRREMLKILSDRRRKFPKKQPNCGSVFVSNPAMYAEFGPPGRIIESLGLKGLRFGDALVSPMHANFIVNAGNATAEDTLRLIHHLRSEVYQATGYLMDSEVRFVSPDGSIRPTHSIDLTEESRARAV